MINVDAIVTMHDGAIEQWKQQDIKAQSSALDWVLKVQLKEAGFLRIAEENHGFNYQLWHAEDRARRDDKGHTFVYWAKREIDWCNQQRNDRIEEMDTWILQHYRPVSLQDAHVNSETPGMMLDRMSILSLKIYHMAIQTHRQTAAVEHRKKCHEKWQILVLQRQQLRVCLSHFLKALSNKTMTFYSYQQFKMYNDKQLNPELYC